MIYKIIKNLIYWAFIAVQGYFASWDQWCRYFRQPTKHMQWNSENAYKYYVNPLLGLIVDYKDFWFNVWKKISIALLIISREQVQNTMAANFFSPIVPKNDLNCIVCLSLEPQHVRNALCAIRHSTAIY